MRVRLAVDLACLAAVLGGACVGAAGAAGADTHTARARAIAHVALSPASGAGGVAVRVRGSGFRPRAKGIVLFGARRVASFTATHAGRFSARFVVPHGASGQVRVTAEQLTRPRHGRSPRVRRASARFHVLGAGAPRAVARPGGPTAGAGGGPGAGARWAPPQHLTWYWQLQGAVDNAEPVAAYDIDGFDNDAGEVAALHALGKHVICYVDVGTWEPGRPDSGGFPASVLGGDVEGWPGERWLDVRQLPVLEPIMTARFAMCRAKGFDAVEPDNMDGYENKTGFAVTAAQQLTYDEWIAGEAHSLGMAVFQKNDGEQTAQLQPYFDGALDEQCNQYGECDDFRPYLAAGKPVLNAEYSLATSSFCASDDAAGIMGARFDLELDGRTFEPCW
jgi:hypothetical protein